MFRDQETTNRMRALIAQMKNLTQNGQLIWERQVGSAHRYTRLNDNLVILGPATPISEKNVPRYLFITPFNSPDFIEINSDDPDLGPSILELVMEVEARTKDTPPTDPFAIDLDFLAEG